MGNDDNKLPPGWTALAHTMSSGSDGLITSAAKAYAAQQLKAIAQAQLQSAQAYSSADSTSALWPRSRAIKCGDVETVFDLKQRLCDQNRDSTRCFCYQNFTDYRRAETELLSEYRWVRQHHGMPGAARWIASALNDAERDALKEALDRPSADTAQSKE